VHPAVLYVYQLVCTVLMCSTFEYVADYLDDRCNTIPVMFVLGFYVSNVVDRFWDQYNSLPWTSRLALFVNANIRGQDDATRMIRRTIMRYIVLAYTLTMLSISPPVKKRFPTLHHIVTAGRSLLVHRSR